MGIQKMRLLSCGTMRAKTVVAPPSIKVLFTWPQGLFLSGHTSDVMFWRNKCWETVQEPWGTFCLVPSLYPLLGSNSALL